jgi:poly(A) polymerase Pap1
MPVRDLSRVVKAFRDAENLKFSDIGVESDAGRLLVAQVMNEFQVSQDAARVRMEQRKILTRNPHQDLFS